MNTEITEKIHSPSAAAGLSSFSPNAPDDGAAAVPRSAAAPSLSAALSVRDGLRMKLDTAKAALDELDVKRRDISFAAHVEGGDAKKSLDKMNKDRLAHLATIETLETAILEASRRVADAERAEELVADGEKASRAAEIAYGRQIDGALEALSDAAIGYKRAVDELNFQLDISHRSGAQLIAATNRVLRTAMIFTPMKSAVEFVAPGERRTMSEVADGHAAAIARIVGPRLPNNNEEAA